MYGNRALEDMDQYHLVSPLFYLNNSTNLPNGRQLPVNEFHVFFLQSDQGVKNLFIYYDWHLWLLHSMHTASCFLLDTHGLMLDIYLCVQNISGP